MTKETTPDIHAPKAVPRLFVIGSSNQVSSCLFHLVVDRKQNNVKMEKDCIRRNATGNKRSKKKERGLQPPEQVPR